MRAVSRNGSCFLIKVLRPTKLMCQLRLHSHAQVHTNQMTKSRYYIFSAWRFNASITLCIPPAGFIFLLSCPETQSSSGPLIILSQSIKQTIDWLKWLWPVLFSSAKPVPVIGTDTQLLWYCSPQIWPQMCFSEMVCPDHRTCSITENLFDGCVNWIIDHCLLSTMAVAVVQCQVLLLESWFNIMVMDYPLFFFRFAFLGQASRVCPHHWLSYLLTRACGWKLLLDAPNLSF